MFEPNDISLTQDQIKKNVEQQKVGIVQEVKEHGAVDDTSNFEADVLVDGTKIQPNCPIISPGSGVIDVPKAGDKVLVEFTEADRSNGYVTDILFTNKSRPPVGKAGMWRREFESGESGALTGNLYLTGYTEYDADAGIAKDAEREPERSVVQLAKHPATENRFPTQTTAPRAKIEMYDAPIDNQSHISIEINTAEGGGSYASWGIKFDINKGTFKLVDQNGFGIETDGSGNFKWHHKSIDLIEEGGDTGPLSLYEPRDNT